MLIKYVRRGNMNIAKIAALITLVLAVAFLISVIFLPWEVTIILVMTIAAWAVIVVFAILTTLNGE